jgi:hypothetical protein
MKWEIRPILRIRLFSPILFIRGRGGKRFRNLNSCIDIIRVTIMKIENMVQIDFYDFHYTSLPENPGYSGLEMNGTRSKAKANQFFGPVLRAFALGMALLEDRRFVILSYVF